MATELTPRHRVKARKRTHCDWCGKPIAVGEEHTASSLSDGSSVYTFRECDRCEPYVKEMWQRELDDDPMWRHGELNSMDFDAFMADEHPDVLKEWSMSPTELMRRQLGILEVPWHGLDGSTTTIDGETARWHASERDGLIDLSFWGVPPKRAALLVELAMRGQS